MTSATAALRGPLRKRKSHLWERDVDDWYAEPEWVSERLFVHEKFEGEIHDPACGTGRIVRSARKLGYEAFGTDKIDRVPWRTEAIIDFMSADYTGGVDNIVCNPPFGIAEQFVARALQKASRKVAMLLPANWVQGDKRSRWLDTTPLRRVYFITPRPSMPPGAALAAGQKPGNGTTDYCWMVWLRGFDGAPEIRWLRREG